MKSITKHQHANPALSRLFEHNAIGLLCILVLCPVVLLLSLLLFKNAY